MSKRWLLLGALFVVAFLIIGTQASTGVNVVGMIASQIQLVLQSISHTLQSIPVH